MTWTTITRVDAGDDVTSSAWNSQVKGNLEHLYSAPRCEVYKSGNQAITTATLTDVTWDSETFDTASIHSTVSATDNLTLVRDGMWLVTAWVNFASNSTGTRRGQLRVNDTTIHSEYFCDASSATATQFTLSALIYTATTTDYVTLRVYQDSGGNLNFQGGDASTSRMSAVWIGGS